MDTIEKSEEINQHRRSFLGTAAVTVAAAQLLLNGSAEAQPSKTKLAGMRAVKHYGVLLQRLDDQDQAGGLYAS